MELKKYDPSATCNKCGSEDIDTEYFPEPSGEGKRLLNALNLSGKPTRDYAYMQRTCQTCGSNWREMPLDDRTLEECIKDAIEDSSVKDDSSEYKSARKSIMECEHAESCDKCRPLNTTDKYHGMKPCEAEFQKHVDDFLKRNTVDSIAMNAKVADATPSSFDKFIDEHDPERFAPHTPMPGMMYCLGGMEIIKGCSHNPRTLLKGLPPGHYTITAIRDGA